MTYANIFRRIIAYSFDCLIAFSVLVIPLSLMFPQPLWNSANPSKFPIGLYFVYGLLIVYIAVALFAKRKQSLDDLVARTLVINRKD
jgi:hypothetical protein